MFDSPTCLTLDSVTHYYRQGGERVNIFEQLSMRIESGQIAALVGPSGSGKSTLMHIAGLLEKPKKGRVGIGGVWTNKMSDHQKTCLRRDHIGFIYQSHNLLADFSALENVAIPMMVAGMRHDTAKARAMDLLDKMGVATRARHRPSRMSGGEQQRVAIARAMANSPKLLLADEPTGNLDQVTAQGVVLSLFVALREQGAGALIATHNSELALQTDIIYRFDRGILKIAS